MPSNYGDPFKIYKHIVIEKQNNKCPICGIVLDERVQICLDHDHDTGLIRELLCGKCNRALGLFQDDPYIIHSAYEYLQKHKKRPTYLKDIQPLLKKPYEKFDYRWGDPQDKTNSPIPPLLRKKVFEKVRA